MQRELYLDVQEIRGYAQGIVQALGSKAWMDSRELEHIKVLALLAIAEGLADSEE
jgi:hypothetical protein